MKKTVQPRSASRVSNEAVQAKTGKTWSEWFSLLDKAGARKMSHKEIVAYLHEQHGVGPWWQQSVTVEYEQARGLRDKHEKPGGYEISVSKTIAVPVGRLFAAWQSEKLRDGWLPGEAFTIRKATPDKTLRITWTDGKTHVDAYFTAKGEGKSSVTAQHNKLPDAKAAGRMKAFWTEKLERLKEILES